ncbi:hypothetical protein Tco_1537818 [Tanacetum coccineum]
MAQLKYYDKHNQVGFLRKPDESVGFAEIVDFIKGSNLRYALTTNPTIHDFLVKQFWQTATAKTLADGTLELQATMEVFMADFSVFGDSFDSCLSNLEKMLKRLLKRSLPKLRS